MAKITRLFQNIFGANLTAGQFGEIGSLANGTPTDTTDPVVMQSLPNFLGGWFSCVLGGLAVNGPAIEDMNSLHYLITRQLAYILQQGVPEWDASTTYYAGSLVNSGGVLYVSRIDVNLNNAITNPTYWGTPGATFTSATTTYQALSSDNIILADPTGGAFTVTLPDCTAVAYAKRITLKCIGVGNSVTVKGSGSQTIDTNITYPTALLTGDSLQVVTNNVAWYVI